MSLAQTQRVFQSSLAAPTVTPWIISRRDDLFFFVLSPLLTIILVAIYFGLTTVGGMEGDAASLYFVYPFFVLFDNPHILQTFSRTHADPVERKRHPYSHFLLLGSMLLVTFAWPSHTQTVAYQVFFDYFGLYHIFAQNHGFLKLYGRKDSTDEELSRLERQCFVVLFLAYLARVGWMDINEPHSLGDFGDNLANVLLYLNAISFAVAAAVTLFVAWRHFSFYRQNKFKWGPRALMFWSLILTYWVTYHAVGSVSVIVIVVLDTLYHDIQYLRFMAHYQNKRFSKKGLAAKWLAACVVGGFLLHHGQDWFRQYAEVFVPVSALLATLTLYHYYVDGRIWKFRTQPELKALFSSSNER